MASLVTTAFLFLMLFGSPFLFASAETFDFYFLVAYGLSLSLSLSLSSSCCMVIILQWPGAYCAQSKCCHPQVGLPKDNFFIRGLWPYNSLTDQAVTKCSRTPFYLDQLSSLMDDLHAYWSNIACPRNNGVSSWKSAWKTYGICSGMNETEYFSAALQLRAKVDVLSALSNKGITPSLLYIYGLSEAEQAIAEGIGATPVIRCSKGVVGLSQLYEVYICVDKDAKTIIECPVKPRFTCWEEIHFNPFNSSDLKDAVTTNPIQMPVSAE